MTVAPSDSLSTHEPDAYPEALLTTLFTQLRNLASPSALSTDPRLIQIHSSALFARLRTVNRSSNAAPRTLKQDTHDARLEMDQQQLSHQNLLYEKRHLEREIDKCKQFASIYQDIPFHDLEDFRELAPPEARADHVLLDEHQLMLNRLSFELAERQRLETRKRELMQEKEELLKQSKSKLTTMESVKAQIEILTKTALEVQKKVNEMVANVPQPEPETDASTQTPN